MVRVGESGELALEGAVHALIHRASDPRQDSPRIPFEGVISSRKVAVPSLPVDGDVVRMDVVGFERYDGQGTTTKRK
jgi:hypothetical protein